MCLGKWLGLLVASIGCAAMGTYGLAISRYSGAAGSMDASTATSVSSTLATDCLGIKENVLAYKGPADGNMRNEAEALEASVKLLEVTCFISSECDECTRIRTGVLPVIQRDYGTRVTLHLYNTAEASGFTKLREYERLYDSKEDTMIKMFIGDKCLVGQDMIIEQAESVIKRTLSGDGVVAKSRQGD